MPFGSSGLSCDPSIVGSSAVEQAAWCGGRRRKPDVELLSKGSRRANRARKTRPMSSGRAGRRNGDSTRPDTGERAKRGAQPFPPGEVRRARCFRGAADGKRPPDELSGSLAGGATASSTGSSFSKLEATVKVILWHEYDLLMAGRGSTPRGPLGRVVKRQGTLAQGRMRLARPRGIGTRAEVSLRRGAGRWGRQRQLWGKRHGGRHGGRGRRGTERTRG